MCITPASAAAAKAETVKAIVAGAMKMAFSHCPLFLERPFPHPIYTNQTGGAKNSLGLGINGFSFKNYHFSAQNSVL